MPVSWELFYLTSHFVCPHMFKAHSSLLSLWSSVASVGLHDDKRCKTVSKHIVFLLVYIEKLFLEQASIWMASSDLIHFSQPSPPVEASYFVALSF